MRVSLFGLFLRRVYLMNPKFEHVQLVLSTLLSILIFIALFDASNHTCVCLCSRHDLQHMPSNWIYWYTYACLCSPLVSFYILVGLSLTILDLHVQILELGAWNPPAADQSVQRKRGSSTDAWSSFSSSPSCLVLEIPYCSTWALVVLFILVYPLTIHPFMLLGDVIFM